MDSRSCDVRRGTYNKMLRNRTILILLAACLIFSSNPALASHTSRLRIIEVAPDHWTFRERGTHHPFVPFGVNYTPDWAGWAPDYLQTIRNDPDQIDRNFAAMQKLGVNICKAAIHTNEVLPDPQNPGHVSPDPGYMSRALQLTDIAARHKIRIIWTLAAWGGRPDWFTQNGGEFGKIPREILSQFWQKFAGMYRNDGRVFAFSLGLEKSTLSEWTDPRFALPSWQREAQKLYPALQDANKSWGTGFASWGDVQPSPQNISAPINAQQMRFRYDYLLFLESEACRYLQVQEEAIKSADPTSLVTCGVIQWGPLLRPSFNSITDYNIREMSRFLDYVSIHFYPLYPNGDDTVQIRYLQNLMRWAYTGKPVVLEEYDMFPADRNAVWNQKLILATRNLVSGWLCWTFQNVPHSDGITEVCGLINDFGNRTAWGKEFQRLAPQVKIYHLVRQAPAFIVHADLEKLCTSPDYADFLAGLVQKDANVDFSTDHNPLLDPSGK